MKFILSLFIYCSLSFGQGFTIDSDTLWLDNGVDTLYDARAYGFTVPTFDSSAYAVFDAIAYLNAISTCDFTIGCFINDIDATSYNGICGNNFGVTGQAGFGIFIWNDGTVGFQTRAAGSPANLFTGSASEYEGVLTSIIGYRSGGIKCLETGRGDTSSTGDVLDVSSSGKFSVGGTSIGTFPIIAGNAWAVFTLNRAMTSAERAAYHADGTIPSDAFIAPCTDEGNPYLIHSFRGSTKYDGAIVDATSPDFWANTVDHPSAAWNLLKGFEDSTTFKVPANLSGNIPGTTTKVSNVAGDWLNGDVMLIDWNPYDYDILDTAYTRGANSWGINDYEFGDTLDGVFFKNTATSIKESDFFIYDTDGTTILGKYLYETGGYGNQKTPRLWRTIRTPR